MFESKFLNIFKFRVYQLDQSDKGPKQLLHTRGEVGRESD